MSELPLDRDEVFLSDSDLSLELDFDDVRNVQGYEQSASGAAVESPEQEADELEQRQGSMDIESQILIAKPIDRTSARFKDNQA